MFLLTHEEFVKNGSIGGTTRAQTLTSERRSEIASYGAWCRWNNVPKKPRRILTTTIRRFYPRYKKDQCERCGFIAEHRCQLDVHHIDGNHQNNDIFNLMTLCANCHRLEHAKRF
jgi:hypothetical protein